MYGLLVGGLCLKLCKRGGRRFKSGRPPYIFETKTNSSNPGCHVAAPEWATWHPIIRPRKMPRVIMLLVDN